LEDTINDVTPDQKKKMSKQKSVSYNKVRSRFKKYLAEAGDDDSHYEVQVKNFRENPPKEEAPKPKEAKKDKKAKEVVKEEEDEEESEEEEEEPAEEEEEDDSEEDSESDEEIRVENKKKRVAAKAEAKKANAAAEKAATKDEEYGDEYYDEEDYGKEGGSDDEDEDAAAKVTDSKDIDPKLKKKYLFLWKDREEMTPEERRWKWVKPEQLPVDLKELMDKLT
jgi:hypothetical protein